MDKKEKCSITQKGRVVIHKDNKEKRIYKKDLDLYLNNGWEKGFSNTHKKLASVVHVGKIPWNKNLKGVMKANSGTWKKGNVPWNKGTKGLIESWNKGLTKETDSRIKSHIVTEDHKKLLHDKMLNNKINLGRKYSNEHCLNISNSKKGHVVSEETKKKISKSKFGKRLSNEKLLIKTTKQYLTKKLHNSFNTSEPEQLFYNELLKENVNKTIYKQYKDKRYPFYCDFYIKEDDLFIECNFHWTHGGKPYDPNDIECQEKLKIWQEKAKTSQFYKNAIETWTVRDVKKRKIAEENKLNYKTIY